MRGRLEGWGFDGGTDGKVEGPLRIARSAKDETREATGQRGEKSETEGGLSAKLPMSGKGDGGQRRLFSKWLDNGFRAEEKECFGFNETESVPTVIQRVSRTARSTWKNQLGDNEGEDKRKKRIKRAK